MANQIEKRALVGARASNPEGRILIGYGAKYGEETDLSDELSEVILEGAFISCVERGDNIALLRDHEPGKLLARTRSATLKVEADSTGLHFSTTSLPDTELADETLELVKRGDLSGCSFAFMIGEGDDEYSRKVDPATGKTYVLRSIRNFSCVFDISLCTFPQYNSPSVSARVLQEARSFAERNGSIVSEAERMELWRRATLQKLAWMDKEFRG
jgi:HK97 family phage prohead protease